MAIENVETSVDRWGEVLPQEPADGSTGRRSRRRRWVVPVAVGLAIALFAVLYEVRRRAINSLTVSCRESIRAEDWDGLERLAGRWHAWAPFQAAPLIFQAEAANRRGEYKLAVERLDRLPDSDPLTPPALLGCSSLQFEQLNRPLDGAQTLERALRLDPRLAEARRRLIYFYAFTLQRRKMVQQAYEAIRQDCDLPETYVYLMLQDSLSFANAYDENTKWFRGDRDNELFLVARAIHRISSRGLDVTEDPREGTRGKDGSPLHRQVVAEYLARFPQNVELLAYHLQTSSEAGDLGEVERLLSHAPPAAATDNRFWRYKGWLHAARGELADAKQSYEKSLELNCYDNVTRHQLAGVERRFKRLDQVKLLEELALEGKNLRREMLGLKRVDSVPPEVLKRMALYARECGDTLVAGKLLLRIDEWSEEWAGLREASALPRSDSPPP